MNEIDPDYIPISNDDTFDRLHSESESRNEEIWHKLN
jgi:hypothetical protein